MRRFYLFHLAFGLLSTNLIAGPIEPGLIKQDAGLSFTENKGQIHDQNHKARPDILFSGMSSSLLFHLKNNGISYQIDKVANWKKELDRKTRREKTVPANYTIYRIDINWLGVSSNCKIEATEQNKDYNQYYSHNCPQGIKVYNYNNVLYKNIYPNITLHYYSKKGELKYDYIVSPGGNYKNIKMEIKGAEKLFINEQGGLVIQTSAGNIEEGKPLVFQNGKILNSKWSLTKNILSFEIDGYDPSLELLIDPLTRLWGTFAGGSSSDDISDIVEGSNGDLYMSGNTRSPSNVATTGAYQTLYGGGSDATLMRFDSNGSKIWGTYVGDSGDEYSFGISIDAAGSLFICGYVSDFGTAIATAAAHQTVYSGGGGNDGFLMKFNPSGARIWGTYYGGSGVDDYAERCATDSNGNVYLVGETDCSTGTIIATAGSHQSILTGTTNAFIAKFNGAGVRQWASYYGGDFELGTDVCVDNQNNVLINGLTTCSTNSIISTPGSYQTSLSGTQDAFVAKFNANGVRLWGTYIGGNDAHFWTRFNCDATGNIYVTGSTACTVGLVTTGCFQPVHGGGTGDLFLAKLNASGTNLLWCTYYGGSLWESYGFCQINQQGYIYVFGNTQSSNAITTPQSYQPTFGGVWDAFIAKFAPNGNRLWGTYFGGAGDDGFSNSYLNSNNQIYTVGSTNSTNSVVIATPASYQQINSGTYDGYIEKFYDCTPFDPINQTTSTVTCSGNLFTMTASSATSTISWYSTSSSTNAISSGSALTTSTLGVGTYTYYAETSAAGCSLTSQRTPIVFAVIQSPTVVATSSETNVLCVGQSATLSASGANSYTWNPNGSGNSIVVSPSTTTTYSVTGSYTNGCTNLATITQSVSLCTSLDQIKFFEMQKTKTYPNPSMNGIFIMETLVGSRIKLFNSLGTLLLDEKVDERINQINASLFPKGIYLIVVEDSNAKRIFSEKLVYN